jgi:hypothetical protein
VLSSMTASATEISYSGEDLLFLSKFKLSFWCKGGANEGSHMSCPGVSYPQNGLEKARSMRCHVGA